jgi:predicted Rossmann fold nucleotide-binding protein DprA/Smf involved in DNA uptake
MLNIKEQIGNTELLTLHKTAFLCSRKIPASIVLKCYDWAIDQREQNNCIISGFHSQIEKDVLHYLLKGNQPIIVALARGLKKKIEPEFIKPLEQGRLLIITPFPATTTRVTEQTATIRNQLMIKLADNITIGFVSKGGKLEELLKGIDTNNVLEYSKKMHYNE